MNDTTTRSDTLRPLFEELEPDQMIRGRHRYRLHRQIGSGAFGTVWVGECVEPDSDAPDIPPRVVAIKFFNPLADAQATEFIHRELSALLSMRAECIPRVYDWAVNERLSFFVMDLYRHGSLAADLKKGVPIDDGEAWLLLVDLLRALKVAHRAGLLHLDIKPSNVMKDGTGGYLLIDFGISQSSQVTEGPAQTVGAGSLGYQAPEQRRLELDKFETRTDLWAVGATVWAARTGLDLANHVDKLRTDAAPDEPSLPALTMECLGCSEALDELVMSLLADAPSGRPGGAAEVLERVKQATGMAVREEPSSAHRHGYDEDEVRAVVASLMDPLWSALCSRPDFARYFVKFEDGEYLCREGDSSYEAFLLLRGSVEAVRGLKRLGVDNREGNFIGELSTLTGTPRTASVRARGEVWACVFNAAEFERMLAAHPAVALRLMKLMAERLLQ